MASRQPTLVPQSCPMHGGEGRHSYVTNSSYQKAALDLAMPTIKEDILAKLDLQKTCNVFRIVDYGCSTGPNTFYAVDNIIEALKHKYNRDQDSKTRHDEQPEFHVFFNDRPNNDFNTLFKILPSSGSGRPYMAAGVPGSFYGQLLPKHCVHIGFTSCSLNWLSNSPEDVCRRSSTAWNKNSIQCTDLVEDVADAYKRQFKKDFGSFLRARAEELVLGGLMFMLVSCLPDTVKMGRTWKGAVVDMMSDCLFEMATSGLISIEKVESFNSPMYFGHMSTFKEIIEQNQCFNMEKMEEVKNPMDDKPLSSNFVTSTFRSVFHGIIEGWFGDGVSEELFKRLSIRLHNNPIDLQACDKDAFVKIVLKRIT